MESWIDMLEEKMRELDDCILFVAADGVLDTWQGIKTNPKMYIKFEVDYAGSLEGCPFTAWSEKYVYFPVQYYGAEYVGYVPRNPSPIETEHWGRGG